MQYLHSIRPHPVVHGDLKIQNVLVGDELVAKVCVIDISFACKSKHVVKYLLSCIVVFKLYAIDLLDYHLRVIG